ncbi:MAG: sigma-70 family RNA polymerase sigma factor [Bacteroidetes bacterium]|nr:sigma-70 family RNA polymerase sigma factor [Bacteroidota bacterium]
MDLLTEIKNGNEEALMSLYKTYRNEFISWASNTYQLSKDDGKDIFQDTIITFYENVKSGQLTSISGSVKTYLFTIGKFKTINFLKKSNRSVTFSDFDLLRIIEPSENQIMDKEENEFIKDTVKKYLNEQCEDCKKVLELYYFKEKDMKTIAEEMGYKNADVAKKKKYECFKKLAEMVRKNLMMLVF